MAKREISTPLAFLSIFFLSRHNLASSKNYINYGKLLEIQDSFVSVGRSVEMSILLVINKKNNDITTIPY